MSTICDDYANWDNVDPAFDDDQVNDALIDARTDRLANAINEYLEANGYDRVGVGHGLLPGDRFAQADPVTGYITFDEDYIFHAEKDGAYNLAFHEAMHTMTFQDGTYDMLSDDEKQRFNDLISDEGYSETDQEPGYQMPEHEESELFGKYMSDLIDDKCGDYEPEPVGGESASEETGPEIEWGKGVASDPSKGESGASVPSKGESGESLGDEEYYFEPFITVVPR